MLKTRARLKARMRWGIDREVLSKLDQKAIPAAQATSPMEKEQVRTAASGADLCLKHAITNGNNFFFHTVPSLRMSSTFYYTYILLRQQHTGRTWPCQLFSACGTVVW